MGEFRYIIKDEIGIHARPAGQLVKLAKGAGCAITITKGYRTFLLTALQFKKTNENQKQIIERCDY